MGILLTALATLFGEIGASFGKQEVLRHRENIFTMGFLSHAGALAFFVYLTFFVPAHFFAAGLPDGFRFSFDSLPTVALRTLLEFLQVYVTLRALMAAERSTFGFLRTLTLPLLLGADIALGFPVAGAQALGIFLIIASLLFLFMNHGLKTRGAGWVVLCAVNAAATITLYKYNITYFNSVGAEQVISLTLVVLFLYIAARLSGERPLRIISRPDYLVQCVLGGLSSTTFSFAFIFAPASVITSAKRAFEVFWAIASGNVYFHEKGLLPKVFAFGLTALGIYLLMP